LTPPQFLWFSSADPTIKYYLDIGTGARHEHITLTDLSEDRSVMYSYESIAIDTICRNINSYRTPINPSCFTVHQGFFGWLVQGFPHPGGVAGQHIASTPGLLDWASLFIVIQNWLVVSTPLKNMKVNGKDYRIYYGK